MKKILALGLLLCSAPVYAMNVESKAPKQTTASSSDLKAGALVIDKPTHISGIVVWPDEKMSDIKEVRLVGKGALIIDKDAELILDAVTVRWVNSRSLQFADVSSKLTLFNANLVFNSDFDFVSGDRITILGKIKFFAQWFFGRNVCVYGLSGMTIAPQSTLVCGENVSLGNGPMPTSWFECMSNRWGHLWDDQDDEKKSAAKS